LKCCFVQTWMCFTIALLLLYYALLLQGHIEMLLRANSDVAQRGMVPGVYVCVWLGGFERVLVGRWVFGSVSVCQCVCLCCLIVCGVRASAACVCARARVMAGCGRWLMSRVAR
jgi:hypothetical protein